MKESPSPEQTLAEWSELFADPETGLTLIKEREKENLSGSTYPAPFYLALWLDFFLVAGEKEVKGKWAALSWEEQFGLGIEFLRCYLFQPLYIRLSQEKDLPVIKAPLNLKSQGKFFQVDYGTEPDLKSEWLYPLDHQRFWPALFRVFPEDFFPSDKIQKALEPGIRLVSTSRLEKIRHRADNLIALFSKGEIKEILEAPSPGDQFRLSSEQNDIPMSLEKGFPSPEKLESEKPTPAVSDLPPTPGSAPKRKKKKKPSMDQMELF